MGKDNRQRRAEKARRRARQHAHGGGPRAQRDRADLGHLLHEGMRAVVAGDLFSTLRVAERLAGEPVPAVAADAERLLLVELRWAWEHGWQPAELHRQGRRAGRRSAQIVATAIAADHSMRERSTLHPRWAAQLDELSLPDVDGPGGWLAPFLASTGTAARETMRGLLDALAVVGRLGPLTVLLPPPGTSSTTCAAAVPAGDDPILTKVRALLAQAESTTFEAEAATFTAKAQALMSRHAIDLAMLWSGDPADRPATIRLPIDDPYAEAKAMLLHVVASATRCRAVWSADIGLASVVGFPADLTTTEVLFTSLLVQAASALQVEAAAAPPGARVRSAAFRSSFLLAYAQRVGERLADVEDEVVTAADAELSGALLPVLADRGQLIDDEVAVQFPHTRPSAVRGGWDGLGHERGRAAGGRALLGQDEVASEGRPALAPPAPVRRETRP